MNMIDSWLALVRVPGMKPDTYHQLLDVFGTPDRVFAAGAAKLGKIGLNSELVSAILDPPRNLIEPDLEWLQQPNHHLITFNDIRYPERLKTISTPPPLLFVRGDPDYLQLPQLAMVGSRTPTASGRQTATEFARFLSSSGITITSGLARGIDAACHQGALEGIAGTVALVAHGLDIVYPSAHQKLAERITRNGAVVSEHPLGTRPLRAYFPRRNRIISGLSLGTLVVEAALNSGSLITARHALEQGREIFAIPGSIHNPLARGCHRLIRQGAKLVETADDILEELYALLPTDLPTRNERAPEKPQSQALDPDHQKLLKCLAYEPMRIDELVDRSGYTAAEVASMLLILELEGCVVSESGRYTRVA
ncbi:MAG: DNA-processing protein DprA [Gammaproteobacteria bacterium]|nr:DNA-processing protein DprA [Gammaproteobacteria bacterium]